MDKASVAMAEVLKGMASHNRLDIIIALSNGERSVADINERVKVSQPALSQHLKKMKDAGLLTSRRNARQVFYELAMPTATLAIFHNVRAINTFRSKA